MRSPLSGASTACSSSSVCSEPFISSAASPRLTSATASAAAAWLCGVSISRKAEISTFGLLRRLHDLGPGPDQDRNDEAGVRGLDGRAQGVGVAGMGDGGRRAGRAAATSASKARKRAWRLS